MFSESLLQNTGHTRRGWTTLVSFAIEAVALGLLVLVPLLGSVAVPTSRSTVINIPFGRPDAPPAAEPQHRVGRPIPVAIDLVHLRVPRAIPTGTKPEVSKDVGDSEPVGVGAGFTTGDRNLAAILNLPAAYAPAPVPPPKPPEPARLHISHMELGALVQQVEPVYPAPARITRVQGTVQLAAVIGRDGTIRDLRVISGHPMLVRAAVDAVRQWRYRPYILNGQPVEVETQISVNFTLGQQ